MSSSTRIKACQAPQTVLRKRRVHTDRPFRKYLALSTHPTNTLFITIWLGCPSDAAGTALNIHVDSCLVSQSVSIRHLLCACPGLTTGYPGMIRLDPHSSIPTYNLRILPLKRLSRLSHPRGKKRQVCRCSAHPKMDTCPFLPPNLPPAPSTANKKLLAYFLETSTGPPPPERPNLTS